MLKAEDFNHNSIMAWKADGQENYFCPECGGLVILKHGLLVCPHFAHKSETCGYGVGESKRHIEMKYQIAMIFQHFSMDVEVRLLAGKRRADVVLLDQKVVIECQASSISLQELLERTRDYNSIGYSLLWVFDGKRLDKPRVPAEISHWQRENYGKSYFLTAGGELACCHISYTTKTKMSRADYFTISNFNPIPCTTSLGHKTVKFGEPVFWKTKKQKINEFIARGGYKYEI
jgi:competence CoiA-like predicted nuclease